MHLPSLRLRLTVMLALATGLAVVVMAVVAARSGSSRIAREAERDLESEMSFLALQPYWEESFQYDNAWVVRLDDASAEPLGNTWVEPPLFGIARDASMDRSNVERFEQDGTWIAIARRVNETDTLVVVEDFDPAQGSMSSLRWRLGTAALALTALSAGAAWWLAGRSLDPARRAMEQQRDFIADAAHEMRTPLAIIQASASQALSRQREAWEYQRSLSEIQLAAERAGAGVGSLLELARLEAGQVLPRLAPLRLDLLVEEVAAATIVEGARVEAEVGEPAIVNGDYALLRQALSNLATNACARADRVTLRIGRVDPWAVVEVVDDGPGFDPAVLPHVFTRFRRGDEKGSSGLGLSIVKTIVDVHRGEIEAANSVEGGAVVTLRLRLG